MKFKHFNMAVILLHCLMILGLNCKNLSAMSTLDSRCFSALSQTFFLFSLLFELVLLVGKYGI